MDETKPTNEQTSPVFDSISKPSSPPPSNPQPGPAFFPPLPKKEFFSNAWRNGVALLLLILSAAVTLFFLHNQNKAWQAFEAWAHIDFAGLLQRHTLKIKNTEPPEITLPPPPPPIPTLVGTLPDPEKFTAASILAKDQITGEVLYKKNEYERRPIASLSKLLSALVLLEKNPDWKSTTTIKADVDIEDNHFLNGETYTLEDIWQTALVASSNQAILTLVDATFLDRAAFVSRMNQKAIELGMKDSFFVEPTGLSEQNVSTASDVLILLDEGLKHPKIQETLLLKEITISPVGKKKPHHIWNTNWLLLGWIPNKITDFRGGKTGYITASGYNFTMQIAETNEKVVNIVVLGATKHEFRFSEARDIGNSIFEAFKWPSDDVTTTSSSTPVLLEEK